MIWDGMLCNPVECTAIMFRIKLAACLDYYLTLKMEAVDSFKMDYPASNPRREDSP